VKNLLQKFLHPKGSIGLAVVITVALILVLIADAAAYKYFENYPISNSAIRSVIEGWNTIEKAYNFESSADILFLGDSTCINLTTGPFGDRLGGKVINFGNTAGSSMTMDAWMLSAYLEKHKIPKMVVVSRSTASYNMKPIIEFMANMPLEWGYWSRYGISPVWEPGEENKLFLTKYGVLYSNSDNLRSRLIKFWGLFKDYKIGIRPQSCYYVSNFEIEKEQMELGKPSPSGYFDKFQPSEDTTNAIKLMSDLARENRFQLYFTLQCEWVEAINAGLRNQQLNSQFNYLSQFTDPTFVHIIEQNPKTLFAKDQMQNPNHLWHGFERIYTEEIINSICSLQNRLVNNQQKSVNIKSINMDKSEYDTGEKPTVELSIVAQDTGSEGAIAGSVSGLLYPAGSTEAEWSARACAVPVKIGKDQEARVELAMNVGALKQAGSYNLVIFLRQDCDALSFETKFEYPNKLTVK
jgi:hypothetical protein